VYPSVFIIEKERSIWYLMAMAVNRKSGLKVPKTENQIIGKEVIK